MNLPHSLAGGLAVHLSARPERTLQHKWEKQISGMQTNAHSETGLSGSLRRSFGSYCLATDDAIFFTIAITSLRSLSFRLAE
jgi:hypothetical protein